MSDARIDNVERARAELIDCYRGPPTASVYLAEDGRASDDAFVRK
jgi:hypothetical protein